MEGWVNWSKPCELEKGTCVGGPTSDGGKEGGREGRKGTE